MESLGAKKVSCAVWHEPIAFLVCVHLFQLVLAYDIVYASLLHEPIAIRVSSSVRGSYCDLMGCHVVTQYCCLLIINLPGESVAPMQKWASQAIDDGAVASRICILYVVLGSRVGIQRIWSVTSRDA